MVNLISRISQRLEQSFEAVIKPRSRKTEAVLLLCLMVFTVAAAGLTALVMLGTWDIQQQTNFIFVLLLGDLILVCALILLLVRNIFRFRYRNDALKMGTRFRSRMVLIFALFSAVPAIALTAFSLLFLDFGLESMFSNRIKTAVEESKAIARAYLNENANSISIDAVLLARSVVSGVNEAGDARVMNNVLNSQARFRDISEAIIFRRDGAILGRYGLTFDMEFEGIPEWAFTAANRGDVPLLRNAASEERRIRALVLLDGNQGTYLVVGRAVDPKVLEHVLKTEQAVSQYQDLELTRFNLHVSFTAGFIVISLLMLLLAVILGMQFASTIWQVLENLLGATAKIARGKFEPVNFPQRPEGDEVGALNNAFNDMILQLEKQRTELLDASEQVDMRRRFSEAVLSGVSAGVIGLDANGCIDLPNRKAEELLGIKLSNSIGKPLKSTVAAFADLFARAETLHKDSNNHRIRFVEDRVHFDDGKEFLVRIGLEITDKSKLTGFVVTFDDLTDLLMAQKQAAWADIARRIAHEVKNPLTPIQLSAERLKRRYGELIATQAPADVQVFDKCIETIIRQVKDIGDLVNEFSDFARMPKAVMESHDVVEVCRDAVFLEKSRVADQIEISYESNLSNLQAPIDRRQLSQTLINLIKNATESLKIKGINEKHKKGTKPKVHVKLSASETHFQISVADNGVGFTDLKRDWAQPYVTDKEEGSGLGLSIVKKIIDDHGGKLQFINNNGAEILITIPFERPIKGTENGS